MTYRTDKRRVLLSALKAYEGNTLHTCSTSPIFLKIDLTPPLSPSDKGPQILQLIQLSWQLKPLRHCLTTNHYLTDAYLEHRLQKTYDSFIKRFTTSRAHVYPLPRAHSTFLWMNVEWGNYVNYSSRARFSHGHHPHVSTEAQTNG